MLTRRSDFYLLRLMATAASFTLFGLAGIVLGYLVFLLVSPISASKAIEIKGQSLRPLLDEGSIAWRKSFLYDNWREYFNNGT
ncbi:MAG: hypothetical protein ACI9JM_000626 [Halioglobus sp.]|jgi:hypothetical protein